MTEDDKALVERLRDAGAHRSGSSLQNGCVDCGLGANTYDEAADRIEALSAEKEAARKEERKAILSFIEEIVDWDGVDYEKLTNWIKERGI